MRKLICVLTALLAVGLIAAGCGSEDNGDGETLSKQAYISQADANCQKADKELDAAEPKNKPSKADFEKFTTDEFVPNIQGQIDFIRDLNGPQEVEDQVNPILDKAQEGIDQIEEEPSQIQGGPGIQKVEEAGQELQKYGFKQCGG